jgi:protein TonB
MLQFTYARTHSRMPRTTPIVVLCVAALHVLAIGALLLSQDAPKVENLKSIPMEMVLTPMIDMPTKLPAAVTHTPKTTTAQKASPTAEPTTPNSAAAVPTPAVAPSLAPSIRSTDATATNSPPAASTGRPPAPHAGAPAFSLPSSEAHGLKNPQPTYPRQSRRLNEQGQVVIRVFVAIDGSPQQGEIKTSSGFDRLDQEALRTVMRWRFVPGQRLGTPEAMWFNVPVNFVLE